MFRTRITEEFGLEVPVLSAPMGPDISGPELVAAVSNAGGLGILQAQMDTPDGLRKKIQHLRCMTPKPFGVNFILYFPVEEKLEVCLEERVPILSFFWGDPARYVEKAHKSGTKVFLQVGSVGDAKQAVKSGVDVIIAQGMEAGGHIAGKVSTMVLVPRIVDAISPTPVVAAGGIADARGVVAALALGADAVMLGTRFLASSQSNAHPIYKEKLIQATEEDAVRTILFGRDWPNSPHRTLLTPFVKEWFGKEGRAQESRSDEPLVGKTQIGGRSIPVLRFTGFPPNRLASGDIESMNLLAGQSVGLANEIRDASQIVHDLGKEARAIFARRFRSIFEDA